MCAPKTRLSALHRCHRITIVAVTGVMLLEAAVLCFHLPAAAADEPTRHRGLGTQQSPPSAALIEARRELEEMDELATTARRQLSSRKEVARAFRSGPPPSADEIARVDPLARRKLEVISALKLRGQELESRTSTDAAQMPRLTSAIQAGERDLDKYVVDFNARYVIAWNGDRLSGLVLPTDLTEPQRRVDDLTNICAAQREKVSELERNHEPPRATADDVLRARRQHLATLEQALRATEAMLEDSRREETAMTRTYAPEDIARWDPQMLVDLPRRAAAEARLRGVELRNGHDDPDVEEAKSELHKIEEEIAFRCSRFGLEYCIILQPNETGVRIPRTYSGLWTLARRLQQACEVERDAIAVLQRQMPPARTPPP